MLTATFNILISQKEVQYNMIKLDEIFNIDKNEMSDFTIALNNPTTDENPLDFYLYNRNAFLRFIGWYKSNNKRNAFRVLEKIYPSVNSTQS